MTKLHILMRSHTDYDVHSFEIVGATDQEHVAKAFVNVGLLNQFWDHEVTTVTLNEYLNEYLNVQADIAMWLDPARNPICECGHRLMHHRRTTHTGGCKHNVAYGEIHKCKGFTLAKEQPLPTLDKEVKGWHEDRSFYGEAGNG